MLKTDDHKLWEIRKEYDHGEFKNDATSLGYSIDVYQETINQYIREYLVNFDYLIRCMENFGFVLLPDNDAIKMGLPKGMGNFALLYSQMEQKIERNSRILNDIGKANKMNEKERQISFFNNYFVFKKVRSVDASKIDLTVSEEEAIQVNVEPQPEPEDKPEPEPEPMPVKKKRGRKPKLKIKSDD